MEKVKDLKILIVDDSPISVSIMSESIKTLAKIFVATDGEMALSIINRNPPDLILLDIHMPNMNGLEVCKLIKQNPQTAAVPILFVTADGQKAMELEALEMGGIDYISKPINAAILRTRVQAHLLTVTRTRELIKAKNDLANLISTLPVFISYWDKNLRNLYSNDVQGDWFNLRPQNLIGLQLNDLFDDIEYEQILDNIAMATRGENSLVEVELRSIKNLKRYVQVSFICRQSFASESGFLLVITDISDRKNEEIQLKKERDKFDVTLRSIGDGVIATDQNGRVTFINPVAEMLTGWSSKEAVTQPIETVMHLHDSFTKDILVNPIRLALAAREIVGMPLDAILVNREGEDVNVEDSAAPIFDQTQKLVGAIIVFHDVTEAKKAEEKMLRLTNYDNLTNLPNRFLLFDRLEQCIKKANREQGLSCLVVMDIDGFEAINNTHGYLVGDKLLVKLAQHLSEFIRDSDTLSRPGGDEFAILLTKVGSISKIADFCERLLTMVNQSWEISELKFNLSASLGAAVFPTDGEDPHTLYRRADSAMRDAKRKGRNNYRFFSVDIEQQLQAQYKDDKKLRQAIENQEITLYYQPKFNANTSKVVGLEALLRWHQADGNVLYPDYFIPLAESTKLIIPLGKYVLEQACLQALEWQKINPKLSVAVNISAVQFNPALITIVRDILADTGLSPQCLELEITESILINDEHSLATINGLKNLGVKLCMDDFGKGYSSLSYIKNFPIDVLKIDQSFVVNMLENRVDKAICETIINLAKNLNLILVAEGVETKAHADSLLEMGCFVFQGYYYSKAESVDKITEYLNDSQ